MMRRVPCVQHTMKWHIKSINSINIGIHFTLHIYNHIYIHVYMIIYICFTRSEHHYRSWLPRLPPWIQVSAAKPLTAVTCHRIGPGRFAGCLFMALVKKGKTKLPWISFWLNLSTSIKKQWWSKKHNNNIHPHIPVNSHDILMPIP